MLKKKMNVGHEEIKIKKYNEDFIHLVVDKICCLLLSLSPSVHNCIRA